MFAIDEPVEIKKIIQFGRCEVKIFFLLLRRLPPLPSEKINFFQFILKSIFARLINSEHPPKRRSPVPPKSIKARVCIDGINSMTSLWLLLVLPKITKIKQGEERIKMKIKILPKIKAFRSYYFLPSPYSSSLKFILLVLFRLLHLEYLSVAQLLVNFSIQFLSSHEIAIGEDALSKTLI